MWYFWVAKPMLQGYVASCEHIFSFMATWKCDSFNSRSKFKGHEKRPNSPPGSKVKVKHERHITWAHFVHMGALKIHLLPSLETHVQGYVDRCELIFCILAAWKCDFCRVVKPMLQGYVASCENIFTFMATWKCDSFNSWSCEKNKFAARVKGQGQTRMTIAWTHLVHFGALKIILLPSFETHVQGYIASCELIFSILEVLKCHFSESWNPCFKGT